MMLIGSSFGLCLASIMSGQVSEKDVCLIIAGTRFETLDRALDVVREYHEKGNPYVGYLRSVPYKSLSTFQLEDVLLLAERLYNSGKIHQPRLYDAGHHRSEFAGSLWHEIVPTLENNTPAVVNAYEQYKILNVLTK